VTSRVVSCSVTSTQEIRHVHKRFFNMVDLTSKGLVFQDTHNEVWQRRGCSSYCGPLSLWPAVTVARCH
jgi:hypothetical protein